MHNYSRRNVVSFGDYVDKIIHFLKIYYLNVLICGILLLILDVRGHTSALSLGPSFSLHYQALARVDVGYVRAHLIYIIWQCVTNKETINSS